MDLEFQALEIQRAWFEAQRGYGFLVLGCKGVFSKLENVQLRYHGLIVDSPDSGEFRFGVVRLIESCKMWNFDKDLPKEAKKTFIRFNNRAYMQCAQKCRDTVHKLNKAVYNLGRGIDTFERIDEYAYDGAPRERGAIFFKALDDLPYHLDSLLSYLRILADCIVFTVPFFYRTKKSIANRSYREHRKWFLQKQPDFDPEYSEILRIKSFWFDKLAGKDPKGIRDRIFHQCATYQLGWRGWGMGKKQIMVQQVTSEGVVEDDLTFTLEEVIAGFFEYLDAVYELFSNRLVQELPFLNARSLDERSLFTKLTVSDLRKKYRLYPLIQRNKVA